MSHYYGDSGGQTGVYGGEPKRLFTMPPPGMSGAARSLASFQQPPPSADYDMNTMSTQSMEMSHRAPAMSPWMAGNEAQLRQSGITQPEADYDDDDDDDDDTSNDGDSSDDVSVDRRGIGEFNPVGRPRGPQRSFSPTDTMTTKSEYLFEPESRPRVARFEGESDTGNSADDDFQEEKEPEDFETRISRWNVFGTSPPAVGHETNELYYAYFRKIFRVLTCIVLLFGTLALVVLSKGALLIAVSMVRPFPESPADRRPDLECRYYTEWHNNSIANANKTVAPTFDYGYSNFTKCVTLPRGYNGTVTSPETDLYCLKADNSSGDVRLMEAYQADQCYVMRLYWNWALYLMISVPQFFVFFRCLFYVIFKNKMSPKHGIQFAVLAIETVYSIGICLLVFVVLPSLDNAILGLIVMTGVALIPGVLKVLVRPDNEKRRPLKITLDSLAIVAQLSLLIIWPMVVIFSSDDKLYDSNLIWSLPVSLLLISVRWWENYTDANLRLGKIRKPINSFVGTLRRTRTKTQLVASGWKIVLNMVLMMLFVGLQLSDTDLSWSEKMTAVFNYDLKLCEREETEVHWNSTVPPEPSNGNGTVMMTSSMINTTEQSVYTVTYDQLPQLGIDWVWVWLVNCTASLVGYFFMRSSAKILVQKLCYAVPLLISTPLMFGLMVGGCELWNHQPCSFATSELSGYLMYKCYKKDSIADAWLDQLWFLLLIWWLSQVWITWHIWFPKNERLAKAEKLFVLPLYDGILFEQSMLLNRNRNDEKRSSRRQLSAAAQGGRTSAVEMTNLQRLEDTQREDYVSKVTRQKDEIPHIYICATMWHENETEMIQMLKSIYKLDMDQSSRRNVQQFYNVRDPDYYEFEAHIFFDQAFEDHAEDEKQYNVNKFVELLVTCVTTAFHAVHKVTIPVRPCTKIPTPYGGRLVWEMPGGNRIIAHLKDAVKIRHKKRWSQVFYMYYFLGYQIMMDNISKQRKQRKADHTFLLALDGDVDFEPLALKLLVDLMKRNEKVGAACGRIHPTGTGPLVWYQKFEYALGHWMQKSTEDVIGCVLCSPGCFSLFRGSALMADNVMGKYTTLPSEPHHYIQYDQGEDRWLCTLLLQQGYKVEYCAASDSFTFAPTGFNEFFNQRRRWMPSTMANVLDLLMSWRQTTKVNENISMLYVIYQMGLFVASIIGPGSIFMMMIGAMDVALGGRLGILWCGILTIVPIIIFIVLCFTAKQDTQLWFALLLAGLYCLVQMLVFVGLIVEMASQSVCYPTTVFFLFVSGTFLLCGFLHPQEISCVVHGFAYYLAIPTMYLLLMIYSICNLHVVSWGTREVKKTATELKVEQEKQEAKMPEAEKKKKEQGLAAGLLSKFTGKEGQQEGWTLRCGDCCSYVCCPRHKSEDEKVLELKVVLAEIDKLGRKLEGDLETKMTEIRLAIDQLQEYEEYDEEGEEAGQNDNIYPGPNQIPDGPQFGHQPADLQQHAVYNQFSYPGPAENAGDGAGIIPPEMGGKNRTLQDSDTESEGEQTTALNAGGIVSLQYQQPPTAVVAQTEPSQPVERDELVNPVWAENTALGDGPTHTLEPEESQFFQDLITSYLFPLKKDVIKEEKEAAELKELRNKMSTAFLLSNAIFIVVVFALQLNMDKLYVPWPCEDGMRVEPLGFVFMAVFGLIMVIQIMGMVFHRTSTFLHIVATTTVPNCFRRKKEPDVNENGSISGSQSSVNIEDLLVLARKFGRLDQDDRASMSSANSTLRSEFDGDDARQERNNLRTVYKIDKKQRRQAKGLFFHSTNEAFLNRMARLEQQAMADPDEDSQEVGRKVVGGAKVDSQTQKQVETAIKTIRARRIATLRNGLEDGTASAAGDAAVPFDPLQTDLRSRTRGNIGVNSPWSGNNAADAGAARAVATPSNGVINPVFENPPADYD